MGSRNANWLHVHALNFLAEHDGRTMGEFAEFLDVTAPSATGFVQRLVELGWVERYDDLENRKLVRLRLTPLGRNLLSQKLREHREWFRALHDTLPLSEQEQLLHLIQRMIPAARDTL
jgi:DNA-binding MarR family transcriptional regulator